MNIHTLTVRNRFVLPGMVTDMAVDGGYVTERLLSYYEERAKGGVGLVIVEATSIDVSGKTFLHGLDISDDRFIPGLRLLTERVHAHGAAVAIQLQHGGGRAHPEYSHMPRRVMSVIPGVFEPDNAITLDGAEFARLADAWGKAALRAKAAGFDAVEIHGASGYLLEQAVSAFTNRRTDGYGGSLAKRLRFPTEVARAVAPRWAKIPHPLPPYLRGGRAHRERHRPRHHRGAVPRPHGRGRQRLRHHGGHAMLLRADDAPYLYAQGMERRHQRRRQASDWGQGTGHAHGPDFRRRHRRTGRPRRLGRLRHHGPGAYCGFASGGKITPPGARTKSVPAWPVGRAAWAMPTR